MTVRRVWYWIGARDVARNDTHVWKGNGEVLPDDSALWYPTGEPHHGSHDYVVLNEGDRKLYDVWYSAVAHYICEAA